MPVRALEFNPNKKNLLASGGSEVLIQDIGQNLKKPQQFKPGEPNFHEGHAITAISWNRGVNHILASASENGKIVVWDLKQSKSIFQFTEPTSQSTYEFDNYYGDNSEQQAPQAKRMQMIWNPDIPLQFVVANDEDSMFNIWDLRKTAYPVATFKNIHTAGILSVSWCPSDSNLVLSSAKDNRTVVSNFKTGEVVMEFPTDTGYDKLAWSSKLHGRIAAMEAETGNVSVLSYQPQKALDESQSEAGFATPEISPSTGEAYAPKWLN